MYSIDGYAGIMQEFSGDDMLFMRDLMRLSAFGEHNKYLRLVCSQSLFILSVC